MRVSRTGAVFWVGAQIGTLTKDVMKRRVNGQQITTTVWFYKPLLRKAGGMGCEYASGNRRKVLRELTRELKTRRLQ